MSAEPSRRAKATDPPVCKICGVAHRFADPHVFGGSKPKTASAAASSHRLPPKTGELPPVIPPKGLAIGQKGAATKATPTLAALGDLVTTASERINSKPKRKKPMVAKDGTNRGRPTGRVPFDKKAHDRAKSKERRDAKKAKVKP